MKNAVEKWTKEMLETRSDEIQGFALACVGTKHTSYWAFSSEGWTYDENEARIFPDRNSATAVMIGPAKRFFKYTRLVPVVAVCRDMFLPTVKGY